MAAKKLVKKPAKKPKTPKTTPDAADPRFEPVARAFAKKPGFSLMESKSRATRGLMLGGKSFGMVTHGRLILKLNDERALAHIAKGIGKPFSPSPGKTMKGWLEVTSPKADWLALAKEAFELAATGKPAAKQARARK